MNKAIKYLDKISELFLSCFLLFIVGYIFYASYSVTLYRFTLLSYEKKLGLFCLMAFIPTIYLVIRKKLYRRKDFLFLCIMITGLLISYIYSIDKSISLYGRELRYEGIVAILSYYLIYLASRSISNTKVQKAVLFLLIGTLFIQIGYAYLQTNERFDQLHSFYVYRDWIYGFGFVGNCNFFASLMVLSFFIGFGFYLFSKKMWTTLPLYLVTSILFIGILLAGAMSGVVAFFSVLFLSLVIGFYLYKTSLKEEKMIFAIKLMMLLPMFIFCLFFVHTTTTSKVANDFLSMFVEVKAGVTEETGSGRIQIWKETLPIIPTYLFTGSGVDTFYEAFGENPIFLNHLDLAVDKAHNEYLQILVTEGILSLIGYLGLIITTILSSFKRIKLKSMTPLEISLFLAVLAYLIQAFFNIRVTRVAPYFFIVLGFLNSNNTIKKDS